MKKILISIVIVAIAFFCYSCSEKTTATASSDISAIINQHRPLKGATIPLDIKDRLGATHVDGKYYFGDEPYLVEGCRRMIDMGYGVVKLWFSKNPTGYSYNSEWNLPPDISLKELAEHPYYKECFEMPFTTIGLSVGGAGLNTNDASAKAEQQEIYELTKYLLQTYKDRDLTFIFHNWEGDWLMRGGTGDNARWSRVADQSIDAVDGDRKTVLVPSDSIQRIDAMVKWFTARQKGVEMARAEVGQTKCKVYHAIEANKVIDSMDGIPGIVNSVLPQVTVDMVSWSCYDALRTDGLDDGTMLYKGIEYIKENMNPSSVMQGKKVVFLGEIGVPEQRYPALMDKESIVNNWDAYIGVCLALDVPYIIQWELYCNEPKDEKFRNVNDVRKNDEMRGFWLVRPDGTLSFAGEYFKQLLAKAGGKL